MDTGDKVKAAVDLANALDKSATEAIGVIGKDRLRRGLEFGLRYFYAPETLTPEQRKMAEDLLKESPP